MEELGLRSIASALILGSSQWVLAAAAHPGSKRSLFWAPRSLREHQWMVCWLMACDHK